MSWSFFTQKSGTFQEGKSEKPTKNKPILHCSAPEFLGSCDVFCCLRFLKNFALNGVCCGPNGLLTAWGPSPDVENKMMTCDQSTPFLQHSNGGETGLWQGGARMKGKPELEKLRKPFEWWCFSLLRRLNDMKPNTFSTKSVDIA